MKVTYFAVAVGLLAWPAGAVGHVAPSATENNRYLKLTLQGDRVRLSYTVFFGDRPGAGERARMDTSGDGLIDEGEARTFGLHLRDTVAPAVTFELDGQPVKAEWKVADVGLGMPQTSGGAFAVDLVVEAPTGARAGAHSVWLDDRFAVPQPGETEVRLEESPGVRVVRAHVGKEGTGLQLRYAWKGAPQRAGERAILFEYTVDAEAAAAPDTTAGPPAPAAARKQPGRALWLALGALGAGAIVLAVLGLRKR